MSHFSLSEAILSTAGNRFHRLSQHGIAGRQLAGLLHVNSFVTVRVRSVVYLS